MNTPKERASKFLALTPRVIGVARACIGVAYLVAPTRAHRPVAGVDAELPSTRAAGRTFGAREIYVGMSVLAAEKKAPQLLAQVLAAGVAIDLWDTAAFAMTDRYLGRDRLTGALVAAGFTVFGAVATAYAYPLADE